MICFSTPLDGGTRDHVFPTGAGVCIGWAGCFSGVGHMAGQEAVWRVVINDNEQGPLTKSQVLEHLKDGLLTASNLIWRPGFSEWKSISEVSDFWQPPKRPSAIDAVQPPPLPAAALGRPLRLTAWQRPPPSGGKRANL